MADALRPRRRTRTRWRHRPRAGLAVVLLTIVPLAAAAAATTDAIDAPGPTAADPRGEALYAGRAPATARLRGDDRPLPPNAVACANCHEPGPQPGASVTVVTAAAVGPRLDAALAQSAPRRGGPASTYDATSFCHLLRTGVDPAQVLVRRAMPQFELDEADCGALWRYISRRAPPEAPTR